MRLLLYIVICITSLTACSANKEQIVPAYGSNFERFLDNVRIKHKDAYGIVYEYKDVRIDEIAYMASEYCYNQSNKKAVLHSSQLYKNFSRRASFHCI